MIGKDRLLMLLHVFGVLSEIFRRTPCDRENFESDLLCHV